MADELVTLALERFRLAVSTDGEPLGIPLTGPNTALSLRGQAHGFARRLARERHRATGHVPSGSAVADAVRVLAGEATDRPPEPVGLRVAAHEDSVVYDLGDDTGRAVIIDAGGWRVVGRSPVTFRRSALTAPQVEPQRGGDFEDLWSLVRVAEHSRPLLLAWLVHALLADEAHAILAVGGEHGAGKTLLLRLVGALIDPSAADIRSEPEGIEQVAVTAHGSHLVTYDNLSSVPAWLSDVLCSVATGGGVVTRALYTDTDLSVMRFRRPIALGYIDPGPLRGDLADRLLAIDLERIPPGERRSERDLAQARAAARPRLFGALLDLLAAVLAERPRMPRPPELPRMADYALTLAAVDGLRGTSGLATYLAQGRRLAEDVVGADPVAVAVETLVRERDAWEGTAAELHAAITPEHPPRGWPGAPNVLAGRLKRLAPNLRAVGIHVEVPDPGARPKIWRLSVDPQSPASDRRDRPTDENCTGDPWEADSGPSVPNGCTAGPTDRRANRRTENRPGAPEKADSVDPSIPSIRPTVSPSGGPQGAPETEPADDGETSADPHDPAAGAAADLDAEEPFEWSL